MNSRLGWICPKCNASVNPDVTNCPCKSNFSTTTIKPSATTLPTSVHFPASIKDILVGTTISITPNGADAEYKSNANGMVHRSPTVEKICGSGGGTYKNGNSSMYEEF